MSLHQAAGHPHPSNSLPARRHGHRGAGKAAGAVVLLALALLVAGCDQAVTVPARFPEPVIESMPLRVGVVYTPAFRDHVHTETLGGDATWTIRTGEANVALFDAVFRQLFAEVRLLESVPAGSPAPGLDAVVEPAVTGFEFALPAQSGTDQYSVWIRYTLNVYGPDGRPITAWRINAYGQSSAKALRPARSLEMAARQAMRDAAATISLDFASEPRIREVLLGEGATGAPAGRADGTGAGLNPAGDTEREGTADEPASSPARGPATETP